MLLSTKLQKSLCCSVYGRGFWGRAPTPDIVQALLSAVEQQINDRDLVLKRSVQLPVLGVAAEVLVLKSDTCPSRLRLVNVAPGSGSGEVVVYANSLANADQREKHEMTKNTDKQQPYSPRLHLSHMYVKNQ